MVNTNALQAILVGRIPWLRIGKNLRDGTLQALSIVATHVGTGRTAVFIQRGEQIFNDEKRRLVKTRFRKLILNIRGMEVTGFEVNESPAASSVATPEKATPQ